MSLLKTKAQESRANTLPAGDYLVKVSRMIETDDQHKAFDDADAVAKEDWKDATPQIAVVFSSKDGVFTHRYNCKGFVRFAELTKEQQSKCFSAGAESYAVKNKDKTRVEDKDRTAKAMQMVHDLCARAGVKVGESWESLVGKEVVITIEENSQGNLRVTKSKKASALKVVAEEENELD